MFRRFKEAITGTDIPPGTVILRTSSNPEDPYLSVTNVRGNGAYNTIFFREKTFLEPFNMTNGRKEVAEHGFDYEGDGLNNPGQEIIIYQSED